MTWLMMCFVLIGGKAQDIEASVYPTHQSCYEQAARNGEVHTKAEDHWCSCFPPTTVKRDNPRIREEVAEVRKGSK